MPAARSPLGESERAIAFAIKASDLAPGNFDLRLSCRMPAARRRRPRKPRPISPAPSPSSRKTRARCGRCRRRRYTLDRPDEALNLALQAAALAPERQRPRDPCGRIAAARRADRRCRGAARRRDATRSGKSDAVAPDFGGGKPTRRNRRGARGDRARARFAPDNAEYHLHRGHLLYRCSAISPPPPRRSTAPLRSIRRATRASAPSSTCSLADGQLAEATAIGGELLRAFPEDEASAEAVLRVLNRRLDTIDGDYVVLADRRRRLPQRPPPTNPASSSG
jgi:hypothetical protein